MSEYETIYYRSDAPTVREYLAERERLLDAYNAEIRALLDEFPGYRVMQGVHSGGRVRWVIGLAGDTSPGELWAKKRQDDFWSPLRKSRAGKALHERLAAIKFCGSPIPGMPIRIWSDTRNVLHSPGFAAFGGEFWVMWGAPAELVEGDKAFDASLWTRAKVSEYWLAREAEEGLKVAA